MPATVSQRPLNVDSRSMVSARAVGAIEWQAVANAYNGLVGMGSALIPMHAPSISYPSDDIATVRFRVWPRYACTHRLWMFTAGGSGTSTFTDPSGGTVAFTVPASGSQFVAHVEAITSRTGAEVTLSPSFHAASAGSLVLQSFGCFEIPRAVLAIGGSDLAAADCGLEPATVRSGLPIADDYAGAGLGFAARELDALRDDARRCGLFAWASGGDFLVALSGSFAPLLQTSPFALGRMLYNGQTTAKIQCAAYAASGSVGCSFRFTATSGASVTAVCDSTGLARAELAIDCEDLAASDGRRSSRSDAVLVEGNGTGFVESVTLGEGPPSSSSSAGIASGALKRALPRFGRGPLPEFMSRKRRTR